MMSNAAVAAAVSEKIISLKVRTKYGGFCEVEIEGDARVLDAKKRIAKELGLDIGNFELYLHGCPMHGEEILKDYGIKGSAEIFASVGCVGVKDGDALVCVLSSDHKEQIVVCSKSSTVKTLKKMYLTKIADETSLSPNDISLIFHSHTLKDNDALTEYGIGSEKISYVFVAKEIHNVTNRQEDDTYSSAKFLLEEVRKTLTIREKTDCPTYSIKIVGFGTERMYSISSPGTTIATLKENFAKDLETGSWSKGLRSVKGPALSLLLDGEKLNDFSRIETFAKETGVTVLDATDRESSRQLQISLDHKLAIWEAKKEGPSFKKSLVAAKKTLREQGEIGAKKLKQFQGLTDVSEEEMSTMSRRAAAFTREHFQEKPTGKLDSDSVTVTHILRNLFAQANDEVTFFDSRKGMKLMDSSVAIQDMFLKDKPMVLRLDSTAGLQGSEEETKDSDDCLAELQAAIDTETAHPILEDVKLRLGRSLNVAADRVHIQQVFAGSVCFEYTVDNLSAHERQAILQQDTSGRMKKQFPQFRENRVHPLLFRAAFDIAVFDPRGNKTFRNNSSTYQVGPPGLKKTYTTPTGWTRFGLRVIKDRPDSEDTWLHPFHRNHEIWWRAFHGTANAGKYMNGVNASIPQQMSNAAVNAMASIHRGGFHPATKAALGPGVYCSPDPVWLEQSGFAAKVPLHLQEGSTTTTKHFLVMLQVAVKPGHDTLQPASTDNKWAVKNPDHIRAYGILFKEV